MPDDAVIAAYEVKRTLMLEAYRRSPTGMKPSVVYAYQERMAPAQDRGNLFDSRKADPFEKAYAIPAEAVHHAAAVIMHAERLTFEVVVTYLDEYGLNERQVASILQYLWLNRDISQSALEKLKTTTSYWAGGIGVSYDQTDVWID